MYLGIVLWNASSVVIAGILKVRTLEGVDCENIAGIFRPSLGAFTFESWLRVGAIGAILASVVIQALVNVQIAIVALVAIITFARVFVEAIDTDSVHAAVAHAVVYFGFTIGAFVF